MVIILRKIINLPVVMKGFSWKDPPSCKRHNTSCNVLQQYTKIIKMRTLLAYYSKILSKLKRTRSLKMSDLYVLN